MAVKYPYTGTTGSISAILTQLRKQFPATIDSSTLKKYGIAPNNESYLINILRFIDLIGEEGKQNSEAKAIFVIHDDVQFSEKLADRIQKSYHGLFELHGDDAWHLPIDALIQYFRQSDETSDVIGTRQARTFIALSTFAKKREEGASPAKKATAPAKSTPAAKKKDSNVKPTNNGQSGIADKPLGTPSAQGALAGGANLTVRIEINLPAGGDQATYDAIFKSIRANLIQ